MDKNKLILSISILISSIVLGGFLYEIQVIKQQSIEKQLQMKTEQDRITTEQEKKEKENQESLLNECLKEVDAKNKQLWDSGHLGMTLQEIKNNKDTCFKKYPL